MSDRRAEIEARLDRYTNWNPPHPEAECEVGGCGECCHYTPMWGPEQVRFLLDTLATAEAERDDWQRRFDAAFEAEKTWCGRYYEAEAERDVAREALREIFAKANDNHWSSAGACRWISDRCRAALEEEP